MSERAGRTNRGACRALKRRFAQVAVERLAQLRHAADRLCWSAEQRQRNFKGPGGEPRVFILSPYRKQVLLCSALLAVHPAVSLAARDCFTVRPPAPVRGAQT